MKDSQNTNTGTTIEEYLRGCVGFEVTDSAISTILIDRNCTGDGCQHVGKTPERLVPGRPLYVVRKYTERNWKRRGCQWCMEAQGGWYTKLCL